MSPRDQLAAGIAALDLGLPEGAQDRLLAYLALLDKWNRVYNLTAVREPERMVSHHLLDSLAAAKIFDAAIANLSANANAIPKPIKVLDVGSGGGLPGIPLAIARPNWRVVLIDTVSKKTAFLTQARAELGLANLTVVTGRVEDYRPDARFDLITSRAFSDLAMFTSLTRHLLTPGGRWLALKGRYPSEELAALPAQVRHVADHSLAVPNLSATRHVIELEPISS